jgi:hypothetical protein
MTERRGKAELIDVKELLGRDQDSVRAALEAEMTEAIGAEKGERTETGVSYRNGFYGRSLITRVGTLELRVPQDRLGRFSTDFFERYQRLETAGRHLAEMYVQGLSTRKRTAEIVAGRLRANATTERHPSHPDRLRLRPRHRLQLRLTQPAGPTTVQLRFSPSSRCSRRRKISSEPVIIHQNVSTLSDIWGSRSCECCPLWARAMVRQGRHLPPEQSRAGRNLGQIHRVRPQR